MYTKGIDKECLVCGDLAKQTTIDARPHNNADVLMRRRRKCSACGESYTTHEVLANDKYQPSFTKLQEAVFRKVIRDAAAVLYHAMGDRND